MKFIAYFAIIFYVCESGLTRPSERFSQSDAEGFLTRFGYLQVLPEPRSSVDLKDYNTKKAEAKQKAILLFQQFNNLPETGKVDDKTTEKMLAPRCGISDLDSLKRDASNKWDKQQLRWTIKQFTGQLSEGNVRHAIKKAMDIWSQVVPLDFLEVHPDSTDANLQIKFVSGKHDDPYAFDGTGRVLAHAFYPKDGRVHFDDDEKWAYDDNDKLDEGHTDLVSVATHELGHSLGLAHSRDKNAVMVPYYLNPPETGVKLSDDDIQRVQQIYGARSGAKVLGHTPALPPQTTTSAPKPPMTTQTQAPPRKPSDRGPSNKSCPRTIDAATTAMNLNSYFFYGNSVWTLDESEKISSPQYVDQLFPKGPSSGVTAAVTNQNSQLTILFQDRQVYAFEWDTQTGQFVLQNGFPKDLTGEIPFVPSFAFRWKDGNVMLVNGDDFVTYDEYWNKATFKNKMSNYFSSLPSTSSTKIFNHQSDIVVLNGLKYSMFDSDSKQLNGEGTLNQLLKC